MKRKLSLILCMLLAMTLLLSACGGSSSSGGTSTATTTTGTGTTDTTSASAGKDTLVVLLNGEPSSLSHQYGGLTETAGIVGYCLYDRLFEYDSDSGEIVNGIAESYEWIDECHLRITIKKGVTAYDGTELKASDVYYTFKVGCEEGNNPAAYSRVFDINEFTVEDDYTLVLGTVSSMPNLTELLVKSAYAILDESSVEAGGGFEAMTRAPQGGTGKYKFVEWKDGQYILLERNDNYWNSAEAGYYQYIRFTFVSESASRLMSIQSGDADVAMRLSASQIVTLANDTKAEAEVYDTMCAMSLFMNDAKAPFDNELVREAIYSLIDTQAIIDLVNEGYGTSCETFLGPRHFYYKAPPAGFTRTVDAAKAKELLTEAGYPNGFEVTLITPSNTSTAAELIQAQLAEGGITMHVDVVESSAFLTARQSGEYDMYIYNCRGNDIIATVGYLDGRVGYEKNEGGCAYFADDLFAIEDQIYVEQDSARRAELIGELQDYALEHKVIIGLYNDVVFSAMNPALTGMAYDMIGWMNISNVHPA